MISAPRCLLFIESNTTGSGMLALGKAKELGVQPVLFTRNLELYPDAKATGSLIEICETNDQWFLRHAIARFLSGSHYQLCGITTTSEFYTEVTALLAHEYQFPGNTPAMVQNCRDKWQMRQLLAQAKLLQPWCILIHSVEEVRQRVLPEHLPCVVKPRNDTGSYGVKLCKDIEEVQLHVDWLLKQRTNVRNQLILEGVLCEEYINGNEYSVETFAWNGKIECIGITQKKLIGYPYFVESGHIFPASFNRSIEQEIKSEVIRALEFLGNICGPVHTEVKLVDNCALIVEINPRLAGGMIPELIYQAQGIDLLSCQLQAACGLSPLLQGEHKMYAGIHFIVAPANGILEQISWGSITHNQQYDIVQMVATASPGKHVYLPRSSYDRLGYIIVRAPSYTLLTQQLDAIATEIQVVLR